MGNEEHDQGHLLLLASHSCFLFLFSSSLILFWTPIFFFFTSLASAFSSIYNAVLTAKTPQTHQSVPNRKEALHLSENPPVFYSWIL